MTLNPAKPDLWARAADHTVPYAKQTTSDTDIVCRRWFPVDFDPVRAGGISATDEEHGWALERAVSCRAFLAELGWPEPIYADSGNGSHLLYRIDLPNDAEAMDLVKQCLLALSLHFTDDRVSVDVGNYNAARIWKVYGTLAAKGDSTPDRPHRLARILEAPNQALVISREQLDALARMCPSQSEGKTARKSGSGAKFNLAAWIEQHGIPVAREGTWQGDGHIWVLGQCPWNDEHTNESAYIVQHASGAIAAGCHHNGCIDKDWHSLRALYEGNGGGRRAVDGGMVPGVGGRQNSQVDQLMGYAESGEFFHTASGEPYVTIQVGGHHETWRVESKAYREWLQQQYYRETNGAPSAQALKDAIGSLEAKARFDGGELRVFTRVAEHEGKIYLDLGDADWRAVEIDAEGWRVISNPPAKFTRAKGMESLPVPVIGGSIEALRQFVNVASDSDWKLLIAWIVFALCPHGPYPILMLHGEQGSAKSTLARIIRSLIDPNTAGLRSLTGSDQDLMIAARNGWIVAFDNLSSLSPSVSDALCRLATGGGFGTRKLYTDDEQVLIDVQRPLILNAIEEIGTRGDLLDRSVILTLPAILETARRAERDLWGNFEEARPRILGALLTAVSGAIARLPEIERPAALPRLADFALWSTAAERGLGWGDGAFLEAYAMNRATGNDLALDASPVAQAVAKACASGWEGTATELLSLLNAFTDEATRRQRNWPGSALALSNALRRLVPNLRSVGLAVDFKKKGNNRLIVITPIKPEAAVADASRRQEGCAELDASPMIENFGCIVGAGLGGSVQGAGGVAMSP